MSTLAPTSTNRQNDLLDAPVAAETTNSGRPPASGTSRFKKKKVGTREIREMHAFRAGMARITRQLPKRLQGPMFAHVICTDIESGQHTYSLPTMAAYSAAIAPKYKLPVANVASLKRYNPRLVEMGLVAREDRYGVYDAAGNGIQASRISSLTTIAIEALKALMPEAIATESATYAVTDAATEGAPVSIPTVYAPIEAKASGRSASPASSRPDDAGDLPLKIKLFESAIQEVVPDFEFSWVMGGQATRSKITSWLDGQDFTPERAEWFAWGLISSQKHVTAAILSKALSEASSSEYDQLVRRGELVCQADAHQARVAQEEQKQQEYDRDHSWFRYEQGETGWWYNSGKKCVQDGRPACTSGMAWLSGSEHDRARELSSEGYSSKLVAVTTDEFAAEFAAVLAGAKDSTPAGV